MAKKKVNINLLTASVAEHTHQLRYHMRHPLVRFFRDLHKDSNGDENVFRAKLALVPDWNQKTINNVVGSIIKWVRNSNFTIKQTIKAIITARTMLLVAIGNANSDISDLVRVEIPDQECFMHTVISFVADELQAFPNLLQPSTSLSDERNRRQIFNAVINDAIEFTVIDQLSSASVSLYLSSALDVDRIERDHSEEDEDEDESEPYNGVNDTFVDHIPVGESVNRAVQHQAVEEVTSTLGFDNPVENTFSLQGVDVKVPFVASKE